MAKNIKAFEKVILDTVSAIDKSGKTTEVYKKVFSNLSDAQKHKLVEDLRENKVNLFVMDTPLTGSKISFANNIKVAKDTFGYDFYKYIKYPAKADAPAFMTPKKHLVLDLMCRRQAQLLIEKISVSGGKQSVDVLTGAPSSTSKTSKISFPELQLLKSHGADEVIKELFTIRGGDVGGYRAFEERLINTGDVNLESIEQFRTGVSSKQTASNWMYAAHIRQNLNE